MRADVLLKAVADKTRIGILAYLYGGPKFVEQIAMQLDISVSTASFHLEKLKAAGFVRVEKDQYYKIYTLSRAALELKLSDLILSVSQKKADEFEKTVKKQYAPRGKIDKLPVQKMKREIVLKDIAVGLEKDKPYTERDINIHIADRFDDFVTARKDMLSFGIIEKKGDSYYKK